MDIDHAKKIVHIIDLVVKEKLDAKSALEQWPDIDTEQDELIQASWHDLSHYANDDDIRMKDPEYDKYLKKILSSKSERIREKYTLK